MTDAREVIAARLLADSIKVSGDDCGGEAWRGHLCSYHQGFEDGIDAILAALGDCAIVNGKVMGLKQVDLPPGAVPVYRLVERDK